MAWPIPPNVTTDFTAHAFLRQFTDALAEKSWGIGSCVWPRESYDWINRLPNFPTPTIPSNITETGFTDSTRTWAGGTDETIGGDIFNPWTGARSRNDYKPTSWWLVIDNDDLEKTLKTHITSWSNVGALTFDNLRDFVTSGQIPSIASLIGRPYRILGWVGLSAPERVLEWPNVQSFANGSVESLPLVTIAGVTHAASPTHATLRTTMFQWTPDQFKNKELMVYADDGFLKRATITTNTKDTLTFATQTWTPAIGTAWMVVTAGGRAIPGRSQTYPTAFYRGAQAAYASHAPIDVLGFAHAPASNVVVDKFEGTACTSENKVVWDQDYWTETLGEFDATGWDDGTCGRRPDKPYSPNLFKTIHGWQVAAIDFASRYVDPTLSYDGVASIVNLNPAEAFKLAGLNSYTGSTGAVEGAPGGLNNAVAISGVTLPYSPAMCWYSIHQPGTNITDYLSGRGLMTADNRLLAADNEGMPFRKSDPASVPPIVGIDSCTIVISLGFPRFTVNEFKRMFDIPGVFIPDIISPPLGTPFVVDPPSVNNFTNTASLGVGTFIYRPKSTNAIQRWNETSNSDAAQGYAWEGGPAFVTGEAYRYNGDNWSDPNVITDLGTSGYGQFPTNTDLQSPYYSRYFTGVDSPPVQGVKERSRSGTGIAADPFYDGSQFYILDPTKDWNDHGWFSGNARTESGTATGGSTTSLIDSTKADADPATPTNPLNCFWRVDRFNGFSSPYVGFTVEIDLPDGAGGVITHHRLITSSSATAVSVTWANPLPVSATGKAYRIKEPYHLNRWKDRQVLLTGINATSGVSETLTRTIQGNSATALFFTPSVTWAATNTIGYGIIEPVIGAVYTYNGTASTHWMPSAGPDIVRQGITTPHNFHGNGLENQPNLHKKFGNHILRDAVGYELFKSLYDFLNILKWTRQSLSWSAEAVDGNPENNSDSTGANDSGNETAFPACTFDASLDAKTRAETAWGNPTAGGAPPFALTSSTFAKFGGDPTMVCVEDGCHGYNISRRYAYGVVGGLCVREGNAVDMYDYAIGPDDNGTNPRGTFNSNGDLVGNHVWRNFGGLGVGVRMTGRVRLGSVALPAGRYPTGIAPDTSHGEGYTVIDQCCIVKWDVTGGFKFV